MLQVDTSFVIKCHISIELELMLHSGAQTPCGTFSSKAGDPEIWSTAKHIGMLNISKTDLLGVSTHALGLRVQCLKYKYYFSLSSLHLQANPYCLLRYKHIVNPYLKPHMKGVSDHSRSQSTTVPFVTLHHRLALKALSNVKFCRIPLQIIIASKLCGSSCTTVQTAIFCYTFW